MIYSITDINDVAARAQQTGWVMPESVRSLLRELAHPQYRIFFTGVYQVGKSLLADRAYLKGRGLLRSGIGLPTTSVVTEVIYGERFEMRVLPRNGDAPLVISDPRSEDIVRYTTAQSEAERTKLATDIDKVVIAVPDERLKQYAIMDSPGIDDVNESVLVHATFPQLLQSDAVVLVIPPRSLNSVEKRFLEGFLFAKSLSRLMIMISYDPRNARSKEIREELVENVRADLMMMGRGYVPVCLCCYDDSVEVELNTPEKIRRAIDAFAASNVALGRQERVLRSLIDSFALYENELRSKLRLVGAHQEEIERLRCEMEEGERVLSTRRNEAKARVAERESEIIRALRERLRKSMQSIKNQLLNRFEDCERLGDVQQRLKSVQSEMSEKIRSIFDRESDEARKQIEGVLALIDAELKSAANELVRTVHFGYQINTGHLGKLNSTFVTVGDYLLVNALGPFGPILDTLIRVVAGKIPLIRNLMPAVFIRNKVVRTIEDSIQDIAENVVADVESQFRQSFARIASDVDAHFKHLYQTTVMPLCRALGEAEAGQLNQADTAEIERKLSELCRVGAQVQNMMEKGETAS